MGQANNLVSFGLVRFNEECGFEFGSCSVLFPSLSTYSPRRARIAAELWHVL